MKSLVLSFWADGVALDLSNKLSYTLAFIVILDWML